MTEPKLKLVKEGNGQTALPEAVCYVVEPVEASDPEDRMHSKYGGIPYLPATLDWPICRGCGRPLSFLAQFRSDDAPWLYRGFPRMLVFFYCFHCAPWWDVDGRGFYLRCFDIRHDFELFQPKLAPIEDVPFMAPQRLRFQRKTDYPSPQDHATFKGLSPGALAETQRRSPNVTQSKLGGFPSWLQKADVPRCRFCRRRMGFTGQVNTGDAEGMILGEAARIFLFACPGGCKPQTFSIVAQTE